MSRPRMLQGTWSVCPFLTLRVRGSRYLFDCLLNSFIAPVKHTVQGEDDHVVLDV